MYVLLWTSLSLGFFPVGPLLKFWVINAQTIQLQIMNYPFLLDVDLLWPYSWIPWWCLLMGSLGCEKNIQFLYQKMGWPGSGRLVIFSVVSAGDFPNHIHPIHERIALQGHLHRLSDIWSLKPMFLSLWLAHGASLISSATSHPSGDGDLSPCNESEDEAQADGSTWVTWGWSSWGALRYDELWWSWSPLGIKSLVSTWKYTWWRDADVHDPNVGRIGLDRADGIWRNLIDWFQWWPPNSETLPYWKGHSLDFLA